MINIKNLNKIGLIDYCSKQMKSLFPLSMENDYLISQFIDPSLKRLERCINEIKPWKSGEFNVLQSSQYCLFLYYLSNTIWRETGASDICTKLFLLNKALNGVDCFYEIDLPEVVYIGHSVGIVLAKAKYGNYLVLYQNSTVGRNHLEAPVIEDKVILYPNTAVIGQSLIRSGSVISQGVSVINMDTQFNKIAYQGAGGGLIFRPHQRQYLTDFFRNF